MKQDDARYTVVASLLHWLIAALILIQIAMGLVMDHVTLDDMLAFSLFQAHRALGIVALVLIGLRILWRLGHKPPSLPGSVAPTVRTFAALTHFLLYVGQVASPLSGWALASTSSLALPLSLFGLFDWPLFPFPADGRFEAPLRSVHHWAGWLLAALVVSHIAAATWHGLIRKDGVFTQILPRFPFGERF
ncbi:cytochrome b [Asaia platycodi]|uniref:cytochrome b n=1 Tax=Asaia platycodi TaxID=610243 RepID=UPI00046E66F7|nr:cytochrome b [Asaia platycodi]